MIIGIIITVLTIIIIITKDIFKNKKEITKLEPYECGFRGKGESRQKMEVSFYVIAILFIIFDLEVIYLFPYASVIRSVSVYGYWGAMIFIIILTIGLIYEIKSGIIK